MQPGMQPGMYPPPEGGMQPGMYPPVDGSMMPPPQYPAPGMPPVMGDPNQPQVQIIIDPNMQQPDAPV